MSELVQQLRDAIDGRDLAALRRLLSDSGAVHARDEDDIPLVLFAADAKWPEGVLAFLDAGVPIETHDSCDSTPLAAAVQAGDARTVRALLERGADPERVVNEEQTILTTACNDAPGLVPALLAAGADPNRARPDGWTPLMVAAQEGDVATIRALLDAGADATATKGERGCIVSAVTVAEHHGRFETLSLLEARGAGTPTQFYLPIIEGAWEEIRGWFRQHAPALEERMRKGTGASPEDVAALAAYLGRRLPADFRAHLLLYGECEPYFFEYVSLSPARIMQTHRHLGELLSDGTFADYPPRELGDDARVENRWWSPAWVPFAEDSGGNLWCIDLEPGEHGTKGQVIPWEKHAGPIGPTSESLQAFLERYRRALLTGEYSYHPDSNTLLPT